MAVCESDSESTRGGMYWFEILALVRERKGGRRRDLPSLILDW